MGQYSLSQIAAIYAVYKDLSLTTHKVCCCTCGKSIEIQQIEDCYNLWGHFYPRSTHRNLIYYPKNSHAQCPECNVYKNGNKEIEQKYHDYMQYRYGNDIFEKLCKVPKYDDSYYIELYTNLLLELSLYFPELADIVIDKSTGEVIYQQSFYENKIEKQFHTFSPTYKQDLDIISKTLNAQPIEYERF